MRFLCISDIHGHADALAAVLATAERRGFPSFSSRETSAFRDLPRWTPGAG